MATKKKAPKAPKRSASLQVWERYHARLAEVEKHNRSVDADKKKKESLIKRATEKRNAIKK